MDMLHFARQVFAADRYATETSSITIEQVGEHEAQCALIVAERHCNARGMAMGGALYTLADFAAAVAANMDGQLGECPLHWVSLDATVHYLAPAPLGTRLVATCCALKHGRSTALYQTLIESPDNGKRIAIVETTMVYC